MNAYLTRIIKHLVRKHNLRLHHDNDDEKIWLTRQFGPLKGNQQSRTREVVEFRLCHFKAADYIEFQKRNLVRAYHAGRMKKETIAGIGLHITANASGSIRRIYCHGNDDGLRGRMYYRGIAGETVRSLSLKNYYTLLDDKLALLLMITRKSLAWINELPITYYPVSNKDLQSITSLDAFLTHFTGSGAMIPKRILAVLELPEKMALFQLVPVNHMNDIATTMKRHEYDLRGHPTAGRILMWYYRDIMPEEHLHCQTVYSYAGACRHIGKQVNMRIRSMRRFTEERNAVMRQRTFKHLVDIRTYPEFILEQTDFGDIHLELINTKTRLWQEAGRMESCVDTYSHEINSGECAIYHVRYKNKDYTLQVGKDQKGRLCAEQLMGVRNAMPPNELQRKINALLAPKARRKIASCIKAR